MNNLKARLAVGVDIPLVDLKLVMYQPAVYELILMGEQEYQYAINFLTSDKKKMLEDLVKNDLEDVSNFQILMEMLNDENNKDIKNSVQTFLSLIFPEYKVMLTPQSILIMKEKETIIIDSSNFDDFQELLKEVFCVNALYGSDKVNYNPLGKKAQEIADKIMKGREKIAKEKGTNNDSFFGEFMSIISVGLKIPLTELAKYTVYQLYNIFRRYQLWLRWDIDLRARLAGAEMKSDPPDWMGSLNL